MKSGSKNDAPNVRGHIQSISRATAILRVLGEHPAGISLGGLACATGLPRSTTQRIVNALRVERLAEPVDGGTGFCLGPEISRLAQHYRAEPTDLMRPALQALHKATDESVVLSKLDRSEVMVLDAISAERELRVVLPVGVQHIPIHSTAAGKALLMGMEQAEVITLLADSLPRLTPNTRDLQALLKELAEYQTTGIATDYEEHELGVCGFSVPVRTALGRFSVSVVVPAARVHSMEIKVREALLSCRDEIEAHLGGGGTRNQTAR